MLLHGLGVYWWLRLPEAEPPVLTGEATLLVSLSTEVIVPEPEPTPETTQVFEQLQNASEQSLARSEVAAEVSSDDYVGDPEALLSYQQELQSWLQKHKRYPRRLKRRGVEGEVLLSFTLGSEGQLLNYRIIEGSGEPGLDQAAVELVQAASPMPPIPESMRLTQYTAQIPLRYAIQ